MNLYAPFLVGLALVVTAGWLQYDPAEMDQELQAAAERLDQIPDTIGDWTSVAVEIPQREVEAAGATGYFNRDYTNQKTGQTVAVMILCGRHGPISVHTPAVCFVSSGWDPGTEETAHALPTSDSESSAQFWTVDFVRNSHGASESLRTFWAWTSNTGQWEAVKHPRIHYAGAPYLYKMYLIVPHQSLNGDGDAAVATVEEFAQDFFPVLEAALKPPVAG